MIRRVVGGLGGAALGFAAWWAFVGTRPEADPARWDLREGAVPIEVAALAGELRPAPGVLDLWGYRAAAPKDLPFGDGTVELVAVIPDGAELDVRFGGTLPNAGPAVPRDATQGRPLAGAGPPPEEAQTAILRLDRSRHRISGGGTLRCQPGPDPGEHPRVTLTTRGGRVDVVIDGQAATTCTSSPWIARSPILAAGVRRVQVESFAAGSFSDDFGSASPLWAVLGVGIGAAVGAGIGLPFGVGLLALLALPVPWRATLDSMRLLAVPEALMPLLVGAIPAAAVAVVARRRAWAGLVPAAFVLPWIRFPDVWGWLLLTLAYVPLGLASFGSARRWHPLLLQALVLSIFAFGEAGVRLTRLDHDWTRTAGFSRAADEFKELLELHQYRAYPDSGFPIRPPAPDPQHRRIVALGGSSTGGAYQMDNLDYFWPKKLGERLAGTDWEVVNQGVGGWNTLHIRLYVESQIERLDADILALYVGHNDVLSLSPVPYRELYARYQGGAGWASSASAYLNGSRLYNGLKFALFAMRDRSGAVAVPVEDARVNLGAIIDVARAHHVRVLLMTEGLNPDAVAMVPYGAMQASFVAPDVGYLDAAGQLWQRDDPELFLDDCHLSVPGHVALATMIQEKLGQLGWL